MDCAGQDEYLHYHQIFFSPSYLYILVLDVNQLVEQGIMFTIERLLFWISTVFSCCDDSTEKNPEVMIIGTHLDK